MKKNPVDWTRWEALRKRGQLYFVLVVGVLGWGVSMALLFSLLVYALVRGVEFKSILGSSLMIFPVTGLVGSLSVWKTRKREYARYKGCLGS